MWDRSETWMPSETSKELLLYISCQIIVNESMAGMEEALADPETEDALAEFDFLVSESGEGAGEARSSGDGTDWGKSSACSWARV